MPDDLSFLDHLEEWLEAQVPRDIQEFPIRMLETMERMSNELFETLNISPPSISIPHPPFGRKEIAAPPASCCHRIKPTGSLYNRAGRLVKAHPYVVGAGAALVVTVGLGAGAAFIGYMGGSDKSRRRFGSKALIENGMLKDAIVILSPNPMPPMLWPLTVSLLKAGYVVLVAVPKVEDAEYLEKRLAPLDEKSALRVLIYDPEDSATFPPFHRSLMATLTLRFPAPNGTVSGDPYTPEPTQVPRIHAFVSLYPLNPSPPSQPSALPALPTLLAQEQGRVPRLITLYPSGSVLVQPDSFASQILTNTHRLLGQNLAASSPVKIISVYVGNLNLPPLHQMISNVKLMIYRFTLKDKWRNASALGKILVVKDAAIIGITKTFSFITGRLGVGAAAKDYAHFERRFLRLLRSRYGGDYHIGQYPFLPFILAKLPPPILPRILGVMPTLPGATGPLYASVQGLPAPRKPLGGSKTSSASSSSRGRNGEKSAPGSAASSDHESGSGEDLASSLHSLQSAHSRETTGSSGDGHSSNASGNGLDESWAHVEGSQ